MVNLVLASCLEVQRVPFIFIQGEFAVMFLHQPSSGYQVLPDWYCSAKETPHGLFIERGSDASSR